MSYERGMAALNLEMPPEIPRTEYLSNPNYIHFLTGLDPEDPATKDEAWRQAYLKMGYDFMQMTSHSTLWRGRETWMGTATFAANQKVVAHKDGYRSLDEVLAMNPLEEYGLPDPVEGPKNLQEELNEHRALIPDCVISGGLYNSVFTWNIRAFGWEMFMEAAVKDPVRFDEILEQFLQISLAEVECWLKTDMKIFVCHDDIVWSAGPVFHPDWYRKYIFPRHERLWAPLKAAGIKVLFLSDGNYDVFVDDLAAIGAQGFIFEPWTNLDYIAEKYGQTHVIIGNMDCRQLMKGKSEIEAEVERCYQIGRKLPGYFFAVGNCIPYNIPVENVDYYMKLIAQHRKRQLELYRRTQEMSYERGMAAINLEMPPEIPRTEYLSNPAYIKLITGLDVNNPDEADEARRQAYAKMDYDFMWLTRNYGAQKGRSTWMGTATFSEGQAVHGHVNGFNSVEEILEVDPVTEYGIPDLAEQAQVHRDELAAARAMTPDAVVPGGIYNTVFTWAIVTFGWEMFMEAALKDPIRFDEILEGFFTISMRDVEAWLRTDMPCFLCHDDIVWSAGPVFHPEWYRKYIFPRHERLWAPIKASGRKVIYCSDGCYDAFVDDLVAAGADGFIFEPWTNLDYIAEKYGQTHVIIGNMDCRELMKGKAQIEAEVERCYQIGRKLPGYFFAVGNHIPYNVPVENVDYYMKLIEQHRKR